MVFEGQAFGIGSTWPPALTTMHALTTAALVRHGTLKVFFTHA